MELVMAYSKLFLCGAAAFAITGSAPSAYAADCYADSVNGKDSNDGKSTSTPVRTQGAIPSGCTTIRYARGSQFNEAVKIINGATTYANYGDPANPLPDFKLPKGSASSVFQTFNPNITLDGLKLEGAHNPSGSLSGLGSGGGICVYLLGNNSTIENSEVTDCDFGIMLSGTGGLATHNYVHDVNGQAVDGEAGIDPNAVGGAKGIYVMASSCEVSYNTIVNCVSFPQWTGASGSSKGGCDGGATEIAVGQSGGTLTGYKNHHNFAYNTCGFFQASTVAGTSGSGTFSNSEFYYNVMIDTAWMILAQVNNTNFVNMKWSNNTVVQHKGAGPVADQGMLMEMWNGYSSGVTGGSTPANQIFLTNNLMILEGVNDVYDFNASFSGGSLAVNTNVVMTTNILLNNTSVNPGFIKLGDGMTSPNPADFDLTSDTISLGGGNPTISGGTAIPGQTVDFLNRAVPSASTGKTDIGAFQLDSVPSDAGAPAPTPSEGDSGVACVGGSSGSSGSSGAGCSGDHSDGSSSVGSGSGSGSDGGPGSGSGGGPGSGSEAGASGGASQKGCGCRTVGGTEDSTPSGAVLLLAAADAWLARRRRTPRRRSPQTS
jgi:MYXO-CTERM domain-containing protein